MEIICTSAFAFQFLSLHRQGTVHSVYRKTINLLIDGQLLALQTEGSPLSPLSLITDLSEREMEVLPVHPGTPVRIISWSRKILLGTSCIFWKNPVIKDLCLSESSPILKKEKLEQILTGLPRMGFVPLLLTDSFVDSSGHAEADSFGQTGGTLSKSPDSLHPAFTDPVLSAADAILHSFLEQMKLSVFEPVHSASGARHSVSEMRHSASEMRHFPSEIRHFPSEMRHSASEIRHSASEMRQAASDRDSISSACRTLASLIGLGIGLTPSGDDFLCGFLAGMILQGLEDTIFYDQLCRQISMGLSSTNIISAAFLQCALKKQFSEAVCALTDASETTESLINYFLKIGHSSGADTLCGIYFSCLCFTTVRISDGAARD